MQSSKSKTNARFTTNLEYRMNYDSIFNGSSEYANESLDIFSPTADLVVRFKRLVPEAVVPTKSRPHDAAYDLVMTNYTVDSRKQVTCYTGIAVEIPEGHVGLIFPRSSISKLGMSLCNSVGVIDPNYRGELLLKFYIHNPEDRLGSYYPGDRIGQLVILPLPLIEFLEVNELSPSPDDRGTQGFGSSGS